jgi:hypothetical protein
MTSSHTHAHTHACTHVLHVWFICTLIQWQLYHIYRLHDNSANPSLLVNYIPMNRNTGTVVKWTTDKHKFMTKKKNTNIFLWIRTCQEPSRDRPLCTAPPASCFQTRDDVYFRWFPDTSTATMQVLQFIVSRNTEAITVIDVVHEQNLGSRTGLPQQFPNCSPWNISWN